jgi:hypothetical protein
MKQKVEFRKVRDFGEIVGDTFLFIRQNFKPFFKAFIYLNGIFIVAGIITAIMTQLQIASMADNPVGSAYSRNTSLNGMLKFPLQASLMMLFMLLAYISIYATTYSYIALYIQKGNSAPSVEEVWAYFKFYFLRLFGRGIVMSLFFVICLILCIIPGIYVFPALTIFFPIMVMENGSFGYTFDRSFKLLKEEWWVTAAVILVIWIITYACTTIISLPGIIIAMVSAFTHAEQPISKTYAIVTSISQYIAQIFYVIPLISSTLIYYNLVERKESSGLLERIGNLGQATEPDHSNQEEY